MAQCNVKCPICGTLNKNLNLEETEGWFICEQCGEEVGMLGFMRDKQQIPTYSMADLVKQFAVKRA